MPGPYESESVTRRTRINPQLSAAGWTVVPFDESKPITDYDRPAIVEYPTDNGLADYVLVVGGRIVGVVEAKKLTNGPAGALTQAERYSRGYQGGSFNFRGLRVPFLYSTNGEMIHFHDARDLLNRSRRVTRFHTPAALQDLLNQDFAAACAWFLLNPNTQPRLRPYQIEANNAVENALGQRKWTMLLAMATGPGRLSRWSAKSTGCLSPAPRNAFSFWWTAARWPRKPSASSPLLSRNRTKSSTPFTKFTANDFSATTWVRTKSVAQRSCRTST